MLLYIINSLGCFQQDEDHLLLIKHKKILDSIPSGSGMVLKNDTAYIIGDDATGIYQLNIVNYGQHKIPIRGLSPNQYREPKSVKHDFECATFVNWKGKEYLLGLGSGGNSYRDSMLMLNMSDFDDNKILSIHNFYKRLQLLTNSDSTQWNIEGATSLAGDLVILNRGNNLIIKFNLGDFMEYVFDNNTSFPAVDYHQIRLPSINKHEARLSGACTLDGDRLLFSASVEDTPDWTKDGPVLGSFIRIYSLSENKIKASYLLQDNNKNALKEKIESLDIWKHEADGNIIFYAIGDDDAGTTNLFQLKLRE